MKVYRLKIAIKNSKPPIWRRCVIPAGLTYAQLSILLNEIMGWKEFSAYKFEFYQRELLLQEEDGIRPFRPTWKCDMREASETYIDECLDQEEWFSYHLENGFSHRVTIEKVCHAEDASRLYPYVEKYKGDCPADEPEGYNMEQVNELLRERYFVTYGGQSDFRKQKELYEGISRGDYGFSGRKNPWNDPNRVHKSSVHTIREFADQLNVLFKERAESFAGQNPDMDMENEDDVDRLLQLVKSEAEDEVEEIKRKMFPGMFHREKEKESLALSNELLKDALGIYSKDTLLDYAKELKLLRYASLSKAQLKEKIANELLLPSVMRSKLGELTDIQMELFHRILAEGQLYRFTEEEESAICVLHNLDYIIRYEDGLVEVPVDVKEAYGKINTPEFQENRGKTVWMRSCLSIAAFLYGVFPISVLRKLYRKKPGYKAKYEELTDIFNRLEEEDKMFRLENGFIIPRHLEHSKSFQQMVMDQQEIAADYYIPTLQEIESFAEHEYFPEEPECRKLREFLKAQDQMEFDAMEEILNIVTDRLNHGWNSNKAAEYIQKEIHKFPAESLDEFKALVGNMAMHVRQGYFRGHTENEMLEQGKIQFGNMRTVADIPEEPVQKQQSVKSAAGTVKIYPNDPCPCGSGKKYKKCCGRNK